MTFVSHNGGLLDRHKSMVRLVGGGSGAGASVDNARTRRAMDHIMTSEYDPHTLHPIRADDVLASCIALAPTSRAAAELGSRIWAVYQVGRLIEGGKTRNEALAAMGISTTTWWRYRRALLEEGFAGLIPGVGPGRPSSLGGLGLSEFQASAIRKFARSAGLPIGRAAIAWADGRTCSPSIRRKILDRFETHAAN